jgi:ABC-type uncharacterized transport system substrate-binding protein
MPRLGMLMPGPAEHSATTLEPFYRGLHKLGYIEGQNLAIERRDAGWKLDRLPALAAELTGLKVDIIVAWSTPTAQAAKQATNSIPIIAAVMADPRAASFTPSACGRGNVRRAEPSTLTLPPTVTVRSPRSLRCLRGCAR